MTRLRFVTRLNPSKIEAGELSTYGSVTFAPMDALADGLGGLDTSLERPADELADNNYSYFAEGDLLIAKVTPCFENGKKALVKNLPNRIGFATSEVHVVRPDNRKVDPNYLRYLLSSETFRAAGVASMTGAGGLRRISDCAIKDFELPVIKLTAQKAVAALLDSETARIGQLISKKELLLEVLREKRAAQIAGLLTQSFKRDRPTKASGIPWLGDVPSHWELKRLRFLTRIVTGSKDTENKVPDGNYPFFVRSDTVERIDTFSLDCEAVLTSGDGAGVAKIFHHYIGKFDFHQRVYAFINFKGIRGRYFYYFFSTFFPKQMALHSAKSTVDSVRMPFLKGMYFALPPLDEQAEIEAEIDRRTPILDRLLKDVKRSLDLLRERRLALVTACVAGRAATDQILRPTHTKFDRSGFRLVVSAEIIYQHQNNLKFGRVKLQKILYLAEAHAGIGELEGNYLREAAGPLDRALIDETERSLEVAGYYRKNQPNGAGTAVTYTPLSKAGQQVNNLKALLGPRADNLRCVISLLRELDTDAVEAVTTLYAVWNDALIDGENRDDAAVISGVLTEWHSEKGEKFKAGDLARWLGWMKRQGLTPCGRGPRTVPTMTPDMFT